MAAAAELAYINAYAEERGGAVECAWDEVKGRTLRLRRTFEEGEVILTEPALRVVKELLGNPIYDALVDLCRDRNFDLGPLWYYCALQSLTAAELRADVAAGSEPTQGDKDSRHDWEPVSEEQQRRLLMLHQGDVKGPGEAAKAVAARFAPSLRDAERLERCLQAWVHNAFAIYGEEPGHVIYFLPSFMSHSCLPCAVWHHGADYSFVLRARRRIEAGEELTVSYLDEISMLDCAPARRLDLARTKHFWCSCPRCSGPEDLSRGMRCGRCRSGALFAQTPRSSCMGAAADVAVGCVLRPLRPCPANYQPEESPSDLWLTIGAPSLARRSGRVYYEVHLAPGICEPQVGWATDDFQEAPDWTGDGVGDDEHSWAADGDRGRLWHGGVHKAIEWPRGRWAEGCVVGCALDLDAGRIAFSEEGSWVPAATFDFQPRGRSFFPALSVQGDFRVCLRAADLRFAPPAGGQFEALLPSDADRGPLDRWAPEQEVFAGAACKACGYKADSAESRRLWALERQLKVMMEGWSTRDLTYEEAWGALETLRAGFAQHAIASRARERLARVFGSRGRRDLQVEVLSECCAFAAAAYPGPNAVHAWALAAHADALADAAAEEAHRARGGGPSPSANASCSEDIAPEAPLDPDAAAKLLAEATRKLRLAASDYRAAVSTLAVMFGDGHEWTREVLQAAGSARRLLLELRGEAADGDGEAGGTEGVAGR